MKVVTGIVMVTSKVLVIVTDMVFVMVTTIVIVIAIIIIIVIVVVSGSPIVFVSTRPRTMTRITRMPIPCAALRAARGGAFMVISADSSRAIIRGPAKTPSRHERISRPTSPDRSMRLQGDEVR